MRTPGHQPAALRSRPSNRHHSDVSFFVDRDTAASALCRHPGAPSPWSRPRQLASIRCTRLPLRLRRAGSTSAAARRQRAIGTACSPHFPPPRAIRCSPKPTYRASGRQPALPPRRRSALRPRRHRIGTRLPPSSGRARRHRALRPLRQCSASPSSSADPSQPASSSSPTPSCSSSTPGRCTSSAKRAARRLAACPGVGPTIHRDLRRRRRQCLRLAAGARGPPSPRSGRRARGSRLVADVTQQVLAEAVGSTRPAVPACSGGCASSAWSSPPRETSRCFTRSGFTPKPGPGACHQVTPDRSHLTRDGALGSIARGGAPPSCARDVLQWAVPGDDWGAHDMADRPSARLTTARRVHLEAGAWGALIALNTAFVSLLLISRGTGRRCWPSTPARQAVQDSGPA